MDTDNEEMNTAGASSSETYTAAMGTDNERIQAADTSKSCAKALEESIIKNRKIPSDAVLAKSSNLSGLRHIAALEEANAARLIAVTAVEEAASAANRAEKASKLAASAAEKAAAAAALSLTKTVHAVHALKNAAAKDELLRVTFENQAGAQGQAQSAKSPQTIADKPEKK